MLIGHPFPVLSESTIEAHGFTLQRFDYGLQDDAYVERFVLGQRWADVHVPVAIVVDLVKRGSTIDEARARRRRASLEAIVIMHRRDIGDPKQLELDSRRVRRKP